jgi:hypothetical protein
MYPDAPVTRQFSGDDMAPVLPAPPNVMCN